MIDVGHHYYFNIKRIKKESINLSDLKLKLAKSTANFTMSVTA